jgi:hypothetical protein
MFNIGEPAVAGVCVIAICAAFFFFGHGWR